MVVLDLRGVVLEGNAPLLVGVLSGLNLDDVLTPVWILWQGDDEDRRPHGSEEVERERRAEEEDGNVPLVFDVHFRGAYDPRRPTGRRSAATTAPAGPDPTDTVCRQTATKANSSDLLLVRLQRHVSQRLAENYIVGTLERWLNFDSNGMRRRTVPINASIECHSKRLGRSSMTIGRY